jgi:hypothetical protein
LAISAPTRVRLPNRTGSRSKPLPGDTVLVFNRYGDRYFLSSIRLEGNDRTYKLPESKGEAELRAQNVNATQMNLVAALR